MENSGGWESIEEIGPLDLEDFKIQDGVIQIILEWNER